MSMLTIDWPVHKFGAPLLAPYQLKRQPNILRTDMATGMARQRRIGQNVPTQMTAEWLIEADKRNDFVGFIDYALQGGVVWFKLPVLVGDQLIDHACRFVKHPAENETPKRRYSIFKSVIEIRKAYRSPDDAVVAAVLAPMTLDNFVEEINMSRYYTESWKQ
ncbi:hypothetical protein [Vibrio sp. 11-4(1)]|nr:hypothetical protein [Vibrio sp. 11-4(1)]NNN82144.1 hypothetical protein [Vibrio sp. 11-4(1)]